MTDELESIIGMREELEEQHAETGLWRERALDAARRITQLEAIATTLRRERDEAEAREHTATDSYVRQLASHRELELLYNDVQTQLGTAQAEIARLEAALRQAAQMFTIIGARRIIAEALRDAACRAPHHKRKKETSE
jgi:hypothetical protein